MTTSTEKISATPVDYQTTIGVKASPDAIFDALTTPTGLAAWWNPATGSGQTGGQLRFIDMCTRSWNHYIATSLRNYLEVGTGSPFGSPADKARRQVQAHGRQ